MQVKTKNLIVGALIVVFVGAMWYQFVYSPMESKASKAKSAAHDADLQATNLKQALAASSSKKPNAKADVANSDLIAALPADSAEATFFRSLESLRISSGADWSSVTPSAATPSGSLSVVTVGISVTGDEAQLERYAAGLAGMKRIFVVDNLSISGGASDGSGGASGGTGPLFSSSKLSMSVSGRIFSQATALAPTAAGATGTTPAATSTPAATGSRPGVVNG